jgi:hypothetical protein
MSDRARWIIPSGKRTHIVEAVLRAPVGYMVEVGPETRSALQNRLGWPLWTDISNQLVWYGAKRAPGDWKSAMMIGLEGAQWMPGIAPGQLVPVGLSSSLLSKPKFSELIEITYAFGAEQGVRFRTDREALDPYLGDRK